MADTGNEWDGPSNKCRTLCWLPPLTFCISFVLGICCLYSMSVGGLVLGILHCCLSTIFACVTIAAYRESKRPLAIVAAVCNSLSLVLLVCTFIYLAWLLGQNGRAKTAFDKDTYSPLIGPLLELYTVKGAAVPGVRRLEGVEASPLFQEAQNSVEGSLVATDLPEMLTNYNPPENLFGIPVSFPPPSISSELAMEASGEPQSSDADYELRLFGPSMPFVDGMGLKSQGVGVVSSSDHMDHAAGQTARNLQAVDVLAFNPKVIHQGPKQVQDLHLNDADLNCLFKISIDESFKNEVIRRLSALLDRGLFCGYTKYKVSSMHKWPVSCNDDCHLGKLHLSPHRDNEEETRRLVDEYKAGVAQMSSVDVQVCSVLTIVTACRIQEKGFSRGVLVALRLGLAFSVLLMVMNILCLVALSDLIGKSYNSQTDAFN